MFKDFLGGIIGKGLDPDIQSEKILTTTTKKDNTAIIVLISAVILVGFFLWFLRNK